MLCIFIKRLAIRSDIQWLEPVGGIYGAMGNETIAIDLNIKLKEKEDERKRAELKPGIDALAGLRNRYLLKKEGIQDEIRKKKLQTLTLACCQS